MQHLLTLKSHYAVPQKKKDDAPRRFFFFFDIVIKISLSHRTNICAMIKVHRKKPTVSSGTSIFVLSADILNHFVVKHIKFFACQSDFYAIASRNTY
jgi:hypothetical protein